MAEGINSILPNLNMEQQTNILLFADSIINATNLSELINNSLSYLPTIIPAQGFMIISDYSNNNYSKNIARKGMTNEEVEMFQYISSKSIIWQYLVKKKKTVTNRTFYKDSEWEKTEDFQLLLKPQSRYHFIVTPVLLQNNINATIHIIRNENQFFSPIEMKSLELLSKYLSYGIGSIIQSLRYKSEIKEEVRLTAREEEVLRQLVKGSTINELAQELSISPFTVKDHVKNIYKKFGVSSRSEAVIKAIEKGYYKVI